MVSKVAIINLTLERFPRVKIFDFLFKVEGEVSSEVNFVYCWRWMMLPVDHSMIRTFSGGTEWIWSTLKIFLHQRTDICRRKGEFLTQRKWLCVFCVLSTWVVLVGFSPAKEPFRLRRYCRFAGETRNFCCQLPTPLSWNNVEFGCLDSVCLGSEHSLPHPSDCHIEFWNSDCQMVLH